MKNLLTIKHHLWFVLACNFMLVSLAYVSLFQPILSALQVGHQQRLDLLASLNHMLVTSLNKSSFQQDLKIEYDELAAAHTKELILSLYALLQADGLFFLEQHLLQTQPLAKMNWVVKGSDQQIYLFLQQIFQQANWLSLQNFSIKLLDQDNLLFNVEISQSHFFEKKNNPVKNMLQAITATQPSAVLTNRINPFCNGESKVENHANRALAFPAQEMKMVGYLQQAKRIHALLRLPNGEIIMTEKFSLLGDGGGVVAAITRTGLTVNEKNNRSLFIPFSVSASSIN